MWLLIVQELTYVTQSVFTMNIVIGYEYSYPVTGAQDVSLNFALVPTWGIPPPPLLLDLPPTNLASQLPHWLCMDNQWTKTLDYKTDLAVVVCTQVHALVLLTHTQGVEGARFSSNYICSLSYANTTDEPYLTLHWLVLITLTHKHSSPLACIPTHRCV